MNIVTNIKKRNITKIPYILKSMASQNINIAKEKIGNNSFSEVAIEIDGDIYDVHPKVLELIEDLSSQVKEVMEYKFPESFDDNQKN
jgi:hypothetical protein